VVSVAHDNVSGKHSARFESYTSFNMPRQIKYSNIGADLDTSLAAANAPSTLNPSTTWYLNGES
jgi:hypothetical protein